MGVINDYGGDVANLFRLLQRHYVQLLDVLRFGLTTRMEFDRLVAVDPATLTDLERAARLLYLQRTAFGGKVSGRSFGVSRTTPARFNLSKLEPMLENLHARLAGVVIERLDFEQALIRYDRRGAFFYLDPPYWGNETDYGPHLFKRSDFSRMEARLKTLEGRWLLSLNDRPEVRELFSQHHIENVTTTYGIARDKKAAAKPRPELLISNRPWV